MTSHMATVNTNHLMCSFYLCMVISFSVMQVHIVKDKRESFAWAVACLLAGNTVAGHKSDSS